MCFSSVACFPLPKHDFQGLPQSDARSDATSGVGGAGAEKGTRTFAGEGGRGASPDLQSAPSKLPTGLL